MVRHKKLREYETSGGRSPFREWIHALRDKGIHGRIRARLDRLSIGNFGDWRSVGSGVCELRIHAGPGYRVYCGLQGETIVVLLCGGDKSTQQKDIKLAHHYWQDFRRRSGETIQGLL